MKTYQDEQVIAECHKHWAVLLMPAFVSLILLGIFAAMAVNFPEFKSDLDRTAFYVISIVLFLGIIIIMANAFIAYKYTWLCLTETKLIEHRGLISTRVKVTMLTRIQSVEYGSGLFGKIFGYCRIGIANAGTGHIEFFCDRMAKAPDFVAKVEEKMRRQNRQL